ncbi:MAG: hypothetical protein KDA37_02390 [Planctomycetales bacterium]|nr:hypothetical protein [Planctomycetales bacterium]
MPIRQLACVLAPLLVVATGTKGLAVEPLVIDDFTAGEGFAITLHAGPGPGPGQPQGNRIHIEETGLDPTHVAGGARTIDVQSCINIVGPTTPVVHDPTASTFAVGGTADCQLCEGPGFRYGGYASEPEKSLNLAVQSQGYGAVAIDLQVIDPGSQNPWYQPPSRVPEAWVSLTTHYADTSGTVRGASVNLRMLIPGHATPQRLLMPFAAFGSAAGGGGPSHPEFSFDEIDQVYLYFGPFGEGLHLMIDGFSFIENPSSLGDYNGDGVVTAQDYAVWRESYGARGVTPGSGADGNGDGRIDAADYAVWRDHYTGDLAAVAVPEASAWVLLAVGGLILAWRASGADASFLD